MDIVSSLPNELVIIVKDCLWGSKNDWILVYNHLIASSCLTDIKHLQLINPEQLFIYRNNNHYIFNIGNYRNGIILRLLKALQFQRRSMVECEIEDEDYCHCCGEKTTFPFTRYICHDCEKYNKLETCLICGELRTNISCYSCLTL